MGRGLWVEQWFALLVEATATRVRDELVLGTAGWEGSWRLLYGLAAIGSPALASSATTAARRLAAQVARVAEPGKARWLAGMRRLTATGEVWHLRDGYGSRLG